MHTLIVNSKALLVGATFVNLCSSQAEVRLINQKFTLFFCKFVLKNVINYYS